MKDRGLADVPTLQGPGLSFLGRLPMQYMPNNSRQTLRQGVVLKVLFFDLASDQKSLCTITEYNKSFRGWGRGGGDPFAKGSHPHKTFHLPQSISSPTKRFFSHKAFLPRNYLLPQFFHGGSQFLGHLRK
ncbi:hypothetical protein, partial [Desulfovibrio sp.]|uniref:hypothetical protein n=1 Tax=Desulfovibrio sp. TaxID=885 RepID=UPI003D0EEE06